MKNRKEEDPLTKPQREVSQVAKDGTITMTTTSTIPVETSDDDDYDEYSNGDGDIDSDGDGYSDEPLAAIKLDLDDPNSVHIGLRVYTHKGVQVEIMSRLLCDD